MLELVRVLRTKGGVKRREGVGSAGSGNEVVTARTFTTSPPTVPWQTFSHDRSGML